MLAEDIQETRHSCRSRFEKNLRHLVFTSCLGIALCLLRAYDVFGLDGLMACGNTGPVIQWFFFQTVSRWGHYVPLFTTFVTLLHFLLLGVYELKSPGWTNHRLIAEGSNYDYILKSTEGYYYFQRLLILWKIF